MTDCYILAYEFSTTEKIIAAIICLALFIAGLKALYSMFSQLFDEEE